MSDQNLFQKQEAPQETPAQTPSSPDSLFADQLQSIKREDGTPKYDNVEQALTALQHSQEYIPQLKGDLERTQAEMEALKAELAKRDTVEDVVTRITSKQETPEQENQPTQPSFQAEDVEKLVQAYLVKDSAQKTEASNAALVQDALTKQFGDKAREAIQSKAAELGTTPQQLGELAKQSPKVVLGLFGTSGNPTNPSTGSHNFGTVETPKEELKAPKKSLLVGASDSEKVDFLKKVREVVYAEHGVTV